MLRSMSSQQPDLAPSPRQVSPFALFCSMSSLLLSFALLMAGNGLFGTFVVLRAGIEGFSQGTIGFLVAAHYVGMIIGTIRCGPLVNRIGHIRAFAAFSSVIATAALVFPFVATPAAWIVLRVIIGFNVAGVLTVAESWLNHRATPGARGTLLSMYMMTSYLALGGGQLLVNASDLAGHELFMLASMLFGMAVVPVAITRATHPPPVKSQRFNPRILIEVSPVATAACFCSGLSLSALWGMGPLFAKSLGMSVAQVSVFMGLMILSAMFFQFPVGRLSDVFDRRKVLFGVCVIAASASAVMVGQLSFFAPDSPWHIAELTAWLRHPVLITVVACLYGGAISTLYALGVAYANDYVSGDKTMTISAGLVLAFGSGAAVGAIPAGVMMRLMGPEGLFVYTGVVALFMCGIIIYRRTRRAWVPVMEKDRFVALPEATTTPQPLAADPRNTPDAQS